MKVDPSPLLLPHLSPRSSSEGAAPRDRAKEPVAKSATNAPPDGPKRGFEPVEIDNMRVLLRFKEDKQTGIDVIQVIDPDSGKIVRQIPPEEILNITQALRNLKGLLVSGHY